MNSKIRGTSSQQINESSKEKEDTLSDRYEKYKDETNRKYNIPKSEERAYEHNDEELRDHNDSALDEEQKEREEMEYHQNEHIRREKLKNWINFAADKAKVAIDASDEAIEILRHDTIPHLKNTASEFAVEVVDKMEDVYNYAPNEEDKISTKYKKLKELEQFKKDDIVPQVSKKVSDFPEKGKVTIDKAKNSIQENFEKLKDKTTEKVEQWTERPKQLLKEAKEEITEEFLNPEARNRNEKIARDKMKEGYLDAREKGAEVREKVNEIYDNIRDKIHLEDIEKEFDDAKNKISDYTEKASEKLQNLHLDTPQKPKEDESFEEKDIDELVKSYSHQEEESGGIFSKIKHAYDNFIHGTITKSSTVEVLDEKYMEEDTVLIDIDDDLDCTLERFPK